MTDSNVRDHLDAKHERNREQRIEAVKRWVEYIRSEPVDKWGPQQNTVVDDQLAAAQHSETSVAHHQRVNDVAEQILEIRDDSATDSRS